MGCAVHPPVEGGLSCAGRVRRYHVIFTDPGIAISLASHPIPNGGTVRSGMAVEPVAGHIGGVYACGGKELSLHGKRMQPPRLTLIIDKPHDRILMRGVYKRGAGGGDLRRGVAGNRGIRRGYHARLRGRDEGVQCVGLGWCECQRRRGRGAGGRRRMIGPGSRSCRCSGRRPGGPWPPGRRVCGCPRWRFGGGGRRCTRGRARGG
jgi:hypothetical protein